MPGSFFEEKKFMRQLFVQQETTKKPCHINGFRFYATVICTNNKTERGAEREGGLKDILLNKNFYTF